jgi:UDP-2,3-diacylglucosamine pyrophosphatase LpxH
MESRQSAVVNKPDFNRLRFRTLWLSDIHLGNKDCHAEFLLQFLNHMDCQRLYLVGDIFDLLAMKKKVFWPKQHTEVMKRIHELANSDTEVIYIPGNHDMPLRNFDAGLLLNVQLKRNAIHKTADGKRLLVVHGDEFDHAIIYRAMNRFIGDHAYDLMVFMNRWLHRLRNGLGLPFWSLATFLKNNLSQAKATIAAFEQAAVAEAKQRGLDGVVCGHIHKAQLREIEGVLYCNDGDWTESCTALVEDHRGVLQLLCWEDIAQLINHKEVMVCAA